MIEVKQKSSIELSTVLFFKSVEESRDIEHFSGEKGETVVVYGQKRVEIYVGLGKTDLIDVEQIRIGVAKAFAKILSLKKTNFSIMLSQWGDLNSDEIAFTVIESLFLTAYRFDKYKSLASSETVETVHIVCNQDIDTLISRAKNIAKGTCYTRDLVNDNAHVVTPKYLAEQAQKWRNHPQCSITIFDEKQIREQEMGLLWAVGQGASVKPRFIIMEYRGNPESSDRHAIVGKGVTFDSGGLNLKGTKNIESMRQDMAGAGVCFGVFQALVDLKKKVNVICAVPTVCNAIGNESYFPGDIYQSYSGKTVQIKNTDAEGRLILADALSYVCQKYRPKTLIDIATLTGAIAVSFGDVLAGLFSNSSSLAKKIEDAGLLTFERVWRMPLYKEYSESMKGDMADLNNLSHFASGFAGSITAAAFLQEFVDGNIQWAHLDIAGVAYRPNSSRDYVPRYATGFGVRLLLEWLKMVEHEE